MVSSLECSRFVEFTTFCVVLQRVMENVQSCCVEYYFGFDYHTSIKCCHLFLSRFLLVNWEYLLLNKYHSGYILGDFCTCYSRQSVFVRLFFPIPCSDGGVNVCGIIDNTMNATCRPSGGPCCDRTNAPRNDPLIQRVWYNGWKRSMGGSGRRLTLWTCVWSSSVPRNNLLSLSKSN